MGVWYTWKEHAAKNDLFIEEETEAVCQLCGKRIYKFGKGSYGIESHARKHMCEGKIFFKRYQSPRSYAGVDVRYLIKPEYMSEMVGDVA